MTRAGRKNEADGPERRCIATGESQGKPGLVRFVVGPDAQIVPDIAGKLPGRGIWVSADPVALNRVATKGLFARAAKAPVTVPDGLTALVEAQLLARVVELLGLARKAGQAIAGYEKVKDWLGKGTAVVLVQASDGSERGKSKLHAPQGANGFIGCMTGSELGLAFGREHVIHGALAAGVLTIRVVEEAARLAGIRGQIGGKPAGRETKDA